MDLTIIIASISAVSVASILVAPKIMFHYRARKVEALLMQVAKNVEDLRIEREEALRVFVRDEYGVELDEVIEEVADALEQADTPSQDCHIKTH